MQVGEFKMNSNLALSENLATADERLDVALPVSTRSERLASDPKPTLRSMRAAAEVLAIRQALQETGWNRKRAAQLLSISYRGLLYKLRQHSINP
jgi:two-component system, NtrC family, response regulator AtoC